MKFFTKLVVALSLFSLAGAAFGQSCMTPFTDNFSGTGALGSAWTTPISTGAPTALTTNSGQVVTTTSQGGIAILNNYCGAFPAAQHIQTTVQVVGTNSGPVLRTNTSGDGYLWIIGAGTVYKIANGSGVGGVMGCPTVHVGDVIRFDIDATSNITCTDVTTGAATSGSDSTYTSGYPGVYVDPSVPLGPVTITGGPQAATPVLSSPAGRYPVAFTLSLSCSTPSSSIYYSTDGTAPSILYSSGVSISASPTTVQAQCKASGYLDSSVVTATYTLGSLTFYVDKIGGSRYSANNPTGQCNGLVRAAYPGSGVNQDCAYNDFRWIWDDQHTYGSFNWAIVGGDTVIISKDAYRIGLDSSSDSIHCTGLSDCYPTGVPSGVTGHPTRFLGENYAACSTTRTLISSPAVQVSQPDRTKTSELFGGFNMIALFDVSAAHDVEFRCLQMDTHNTEHCISHGQTQGGGQPTETPACTSTSPIVRMGLVQNYLTHDVHYENLDIHGMASGGIRGEFGAGMTASNIHLGFINGACWNMSGPFGDHDNGTGASLNISNLVAEGCGFVEEYPIVDSFPAIVGFSQGTQSFDADGLSAQANASFDFTCNRCFAINNTEDGFDTAHIEKAGATNSVTFTQSGAWGNMGSALKTGPGITNRTISNNLLISNCMRLSAPLTGAPSIYNKYLTDFCRAGDSIPIRYTSTSTINIYNNTLVGAANTFFDVGCGNDTGTNFAATCGGATFNIKNNILIGASDANCASSGYPCDYGGNANPGLFYFSYSQGCCTEIQASTGDLLYGTMNRSNNIIYNLRNVGTLRSGEAVTSPLLTGQPNVVGFTDESIFDAFDFVLTSSSPAKLTGATISSVTTDFFGTARTAPYDIGAYAFTSTLPTAAAPTFSPVDGYTGAATSLTITCSTTGATPYYTTSGGTPGTAYASPVAVSATSTYRAMCSASGYTDSGIVSDTLTITTGLPGAHVGRGLVMGRGVRIGR